MSKLFIQVLFTAVASLATLATAADPSYTQWAFLNECSAAYSFSQTLSLSAVPGSVSQVALTMNDGFRLCLTSANASTGAYMSLAFAPCASGAAQSWTLGADGTLTGPQGSVAAAASTPSGPFWWGLPLAVRASGAGDVWSFTGGGALVHKASGLCLDAGPLPNAHGCLDAAVRSLPFCDADVPVADRVADLLGRLSIAEKIALTGSGPYSDDCDLTDVGVPRLDVRPHMWLTETNSIIASQCYGNTCATQWPSGNNLASTFNSTVFTQKGYVLGTEMRALNNLGWHRADTQSQTRIGLNGFGPDINQPRDPRNGRAGELASEDPFLIGSYAVGMVRAGQSDPLDPRTLKMSLGLKHYAGYSMETGRMTSTGSFSYYDLFDTYLVPYEMAFVEGGATGSMCSYISLGITLNGTSPQNAASFIPACANTFLLQTLVREYWGRADAVHTSDCGAVKNMASPRLGPTGYAANTTVASADALNGGMDLNTETTVPTHLAEALALGLTTEAVLDASLSRTLSLRIRLGLLDPLERQPLTRLQNFGQATVGAPAHTAAAMDAAAQSIVLLKNAGGALPLAPGARLAVVGTLAAADRALLGDYYADAVCPGGADNQKGGYACVPTIASSLGAYAGSVVNFTGVGMTGNDTTWSAALAAAAAADAVVLCLGADGSIGSEGTDISSIALPGLQAAFGLAVLAAAGSKPVILVLVSPFPTAFDPLADGVSAIVLAGTPAFGAPALAQALFGRTNRFGRVSQSIYPAAYQSAVALADFSMVPRTQPMPNPGRGYRYYNGAAGPLLARFGEGLTYSSGVTLACGGGLQADELVVACNITCGGSVGGDQVLTAFHRASPDIIGRIAGAHPVPLHTLVAFERVAVPAGATVAVTLRAPAARALALIDETGASVLYPGLHFFDVWDGGANNITVAVESPTLTAVVLKRPPLPSE